MLYDPYEASINWDAISPYLNTWGEVIINHMVSDTKRGVLLAQKHATVAKYENTYQKDIDEITKLGSDKNGLEKAILDIIDEQTEKSSREHYIASFPFFTRNNVLLYNLIYVSSNIKGLILYKKVAWKTFGGKSSLKNTHGQEDQLVFSLDGGAFFESNTDDSCYYVKDIAKDIYNKFSQHHEVDMESIYFYLERHPIFPSEGFRRQIKEELKSTYGVSFDTKRNLAIF